MLGLQAQTSSGGGKSREDVVRDGDQQAKVLANAPDAREGFFAVPKVVE